MVEAALKLRPLKSVQHHMLLNLQTSGSRRPEALQICEEKCTATIEVTLVARHAVRVEALSTPCAILQARLGRPVTLVLSVLAYGTREGCTIQAWHVDLTTYLLSQTVRVFVGPFPLGCC